LKVAIKAALDAGDLERAARLLEILRDLPARGIRKVEGA
jgi:hypothetical protein